MLRNVLGPVAARLGAAGLLAVSLWVGTSLVLAKAPPSLTQGSTVAVSELPAQGQKTYELIAQGGPFPYDKDGTVFGNRERALPAQKRGYYREYTVKTPYERSRGAKRIVCGGEKPVAPDVCYYTDDHYASFRKIVK
jgi:ribonuclease T1